jgi:hypothetical protein
MLIPILKGIYQLISVKDEQRLLKDIQDKHKAYLILIYTLI